MGLLLIDCWLCISFVMSMGFVSMLLFTYVMQSNGDISWFLKIYLLIFLGFFLYSSMYLDMVFLIHYWVYFVVILRACICAVWRSELWLLYILAY